MKSLIVALATLALIALFVVLLAPEQRPLSAKERELFITQSPARCQDGLRAAFAARAATVIAPRRAIALRNQICAPEVVTLPMVVMTR